MIGLKSYKLILKSSNPKNPRSDKINNETINFCKIK